MEYPWHHHPPPPLYPPPLQPPPPPQPPHHFLNPPPFSHSHNHTPISQLHHQHPNPQSQPNQILNSQFHNQHPNFELSHNRHPGFELLHDQHPGFQLQDPNPSLRLHDHSANSQFHNQNPSFQPHDRYPSLQSHNQNPNFQPHNQYPSFELLHDRHPGFELLHDQHPDFQLHDRNPSLRPHDQNPSFRLQDQNPSFELLHDQHPHPSFQLNDRNPSLRLHDQNPSLRLHDQNRSVELLHDQHSSFRLHDHSANIQSHNQNPSFELLHDQQPSVRLHDHSASLRSHDQDPRFELRNRNLGDAYSPFDHGYKRPRPDELGVKEHRLKLIHEHGGNEFMLPNEEIRGNFREDLGLKRPRFDESDLRKRYLMPNLDTHYEIKGLRDSNELSSRVKGEEKPLETRFRSGFEHNHNDIFPQSFDTKSNIPLNRDIRSHGYNISPENRTILENRGVALPTSPFMDPKGPLFSDKLAPPLQEKPSLLFPISVTAASPVASSYSPFSEAQNSARPYFHDKSRIQDSNGFPTKELQPIGHRLSMNYAREGQCFPLIPFDKPKALDASQIFKQPHRATRPDHIVVILRGLPGSGKSYLAKMIRDLELENGGMAPRIHSIDDYFMTEVEKVEESDSSKSSGSSRGKKAVVKMVMEYCYEAELEEAYRSSMLKTFKKTLDEGAFPFVIVDDRNLRVADFAQFWAIAKRSGYEVYLLEATYKDPAGCAARNVHNFTLEDIKKMADQWEEAPSMYLKLDAKSLLQGENLKENSIQEVDMDTDDGESEDAQNGLAERYSNILAPAVENLLPSGRSKAVDTLNAESDHVREEVKELGRSKWSKDLEDDDGVKAEFNEGDNANALSAIIKAYKKDGKSVHWGDKAANIGFSIGAAKRLNTTLEIGPGSGYNSKSNPLPVELISPDNNGKSKTQSVFQERMRAERESTRAVFDRRRHRIGGIDSDED